MNTLTIITVTLTLLGSAVVGGIFFSFSNFIMKAFSRLHFHEGMAAMQTINITVLNPVFLGLFIGTALSALGVVVIAILAWGEVSSLFFLIGALLYFIGTFLITGFGNVPLNNRLGSIEVTDSGAGSIWQHYLKQWTQLNTIRTTSAVSASILLLIGLIRY